MAKHDKHDEPEKHPAHHAPAHHAPAHPQHAPAHPAAPAPKQSSPKFAVGDKVKYQDQDGEVTEVVVQAGGTPLYSVKVPAPSGAAHKFDTFGCVPESEIS